MKPRQVSRRTLLSLLGLVKPDASPVDEPTGVVAAGAVFSLEAFYARREVERAAGREPNGFGEEAKP